MSLLKGRYKILEVLSNAGGFGQTLLAEDTDTPSRRRCVIKKLKPIADLDRDGLVKERFQREAAILERLGKSIDQIPELYAFFVENQEFYLVQELIDGLTLRQKVDQEGTLNETEVQEILSSLLNLLASVHEQNIIHRDIKPDNIILRRRDNKPVLIDLGIVKEVLRLDVDGNPTSSIVAGTRGYMAGEQATGRPVFPSDLFSLGMTGIYLLTGKDPQDLPDLNGEMNWRHLAPKTNARFAEVLDRSIKPLASDRYRTAQAMRQDLQKILRHSHVSVNDNALYTTELDTHLRPTPTERYLIPFRKGDRMGFCDINKKIVIEAKYEFTQPFCEGRAVVRLNDKDGFIDKSGNLVTEIKYDFASSFSEGLACVGYGDNQTNLSKKGFGYVDKLGREIIPTQYSYANSFSEGLALVNKGFIDQTGTLVISNSKFGGLNSFSEGLAVVGNELHQGFIDKTGDIVIPIRYRRARSFSEGLACVHADEAYAKVIDKRNNVVNSNEYHYFYDADSFSEGAIVVSKIYDRKKGFVDHENNLIIPQKYTDAESFSEGLASVTIGDKAGFIDKGDNVVIDFKYDRAYPFSEGLALVRQGNSLFYIDKNGTEYYER